ncbi:YkgJ family cysteine cluster protein [Candidatus Thiosymbion oneisti]|uniref:YkgJ family cysteine cluster protein n=1 Tax=Candidatus Thiosymbion oneisti TaxID=589554 RepID=UPI00105E5250|nr:YkgJ family cysteine cluster protein [Candidatus Thiosymbion oneisti]
MNNERFDLPFESPNLPQLLTADTGFKFRCYQGIACFNACCRRADVTLAPYDILRLKSRFGLTSEEFLKHYTVPFRMDQDGVPGLKLRTDDAGTCLMLDGDNGCKVYADRPTVCRYYPVALLNMRKKDSSQAEENYSLISESYCKGHLEDREISIQDYRIEQGCKEYDDRNRDWYRLILKKKSAGPGVGRPSEMSRQVFFMASYNLDMFRRFVLSENFRRSYKLDDAFFQAAATDDLLLMDFAFRFLRQALFGERTIEEVENAWEKRVEERKEIWKLRTQAELARKQQDADDKYRIEAE